MLHCCEQAVVKLFAGAGYLAVLIQLRFMSLFEGRSRLACDKQTDNVQLPASRLVSYTCKSVKSRPVYSAGWQTRAGQKLAFE